LPHSLSSVLRVEKWEFLSTGLGFAYINWFMPLARHSSMVGRTGNENLEMKFLALNTFFIALNFFTLQLASKPHEPILAWLDGEAFRSRIVFVCLGRFFGFGNIS
jgi:hypothetical protein